MASNNNRRHYSDKNSKFSNSFTTGVPIALLAMILSGLLLLTLSAFLAIKAESPLSIAGIAAICSLYACSAVGGAVSSLTLNRPLSYLCVLSASSAFIIILIALKTVIPNSGASPTGFRAVIMHAAIIVFALLSALLTDKAKGKNSRRRKNRR